MAIATVRLEAWSDLSRTEFQVKFDPSEISLLPADSGCLMQIPVEVSPDGLQLGAPCLIAVHGTVKFVDVSAQTGVEVPMQSILPNYRILRVPMTTADIVRIEGRRAGGPDLPCHLNLAGIANIPFKAHPGYQGAQQGVITVAVHDNVGAPFTIGREHWLKMLTQARHGWTRLIELPTLAGPAADEWAGCTGLLERATTEYRSGANEAAIATCRLALEGIVTVMAKHWSVTRRQGQSMESWLKELEGRLADAWPEDGEAARVLTRLYAALWSWTSESHHYRSKVPLHKEASFAIGLTAELLTHGGHLLTAHPEPVKTEPTKAPVPAIHGSTTSTASS